VAVISIFISLMKFIWSNSNNEDDFTSVLLIHLIYAFSNLQSIRFYILSIKMRNLHHKSINQYEEFPLPSIKSSTKEGLSVYWSFEIYFRSISFVNSQFHCKEFCWIVIRAWLKISSSSWLVIHTSKDLQQSRSQILSREGSGGPPEYISAFSIKQRLSNYEQF